MAQTVKGAAGAQLTPNQREQLSREAAGRSLANAGTGIKSSRGIIQVQGKRVTVKERGK